MPIKVKDLKPGDVLYDVHSERAGHTTMRRQGCWTVHVVDVDVDGQWALVSWNGNPSRKMYGSVPYTRWPKEWISSDLFGARTCSICYGKEPNHESNCEHPRAVSARKKAAKT